MPHGIVPMRPAIDVHEEHDLLACLVDDGALLKLVD
jgi:hypothetical protein